MPPPLKVGALSDAFVWRLSVAYIGPNSRTERRRKTKIDIEVANVTRDSDPTFNVRRSRSPGRLAHRRIGASGGGSGGRENVLAVGNCCYVAVCSAAQGASAPTVIGEGRGHTVAAAHLELVSWHVIHSDDARRTASKKTFKIGLTGGGVELDKYLSQPWHLGISLFASSHHWHHWSMLQLWMNYRRRASLLSPPRALATSTVMWVRS